MLKDTIASGTRLKIDVLAIWLSEKVSAVGKHALRSLAEIDGRRDEVIDDLRDVCRSHYVSPEITTRRLAELGAPQTAELLKEHLPMSKKARSGDLGEILATELAERRLGFQVPVRRLRWKDGRNMALRGDDIIAVSRSSTGDLKFLKGESKSRIALTATVVAEAAAALDRDRGRPTRHAVLFVAERLREQGNDDLAKELEEAVLVGFRGISVEHLLFTLSGNSPDTHLTNHLNAIYKKRRRRHAVGVRIEDHPDFIELLFSEM